MLPRGDEPAAAAAATMRPFGSLSRTTAVLSFEFRYRAKNARPACESNRRESTAARKIHASTSPFFPFFLLSFSSPPPPSFIPAFLAPPPSPSHCFQPSRECVSRFIAHHLCNRSPIARPFLWHARGLRMRRSKMIASDFDSSSDFVNFQDKVGDGRYIIL